MIKLKKEAEEKAMHYLEEVIRCTRYDMNCYEEGTAEYEREREKYEALNALYLSHQNLDGDAEL